MLSRKCLRLKKNDKINLAENPNEGYPLAEIKLQFEKQEFIFNHHFSKTPYVKTQIGLFKLKNGATTQDAADRFGRYILDIDARGNHFDDWLIFDDL